MTGASVLSGLKTAQTMMETKSYNISNGMNPDFRRVERHAETLMIGPQGVGSTVSASTRVVDVVQINDFQIKTSEVEYFDKKNDIYNSIQKIIGSKGEGQSLGEKIKKFQNTCESLVISPNVTTSQSTLLFALKNMCQESANISKQMNNLRIDCDASIATAVNDINANLDQISAWNALIRDNGNTYTPIQDVNAAKDALEAAIRRVSDSIDIRTSYQGDGSIRVQTASGIELVNTDVSYLKFTPTLGITPDASYNSDPLLTTVNGVHLQTSPTTSLDVTNHFSYGKLAALVEARDKIIPQMHAEYDLLMGQLRDQVNSKHNEGAGWPPANTLKGTRAFADPTTNMFQGTGTIRVGIVDRTTGAFVANHDFDLTALGPVTLQTLANTVDATLSGLTGGAVSCVCDNTSGNAFKISSTNSNYGVALVSIGGAATENSTGLGFSHFLGLNDLITAGGFAPGVISPGIAGQLDVRGDILNNPLLLSRGQLNSSAVPPVAPVKAIQNGDASIISAITDALKTAQNFNATGALPQLKVSFSDYASQIIATNSLESEQVNTRMQQVQKDYQQIESDISRYSGVNFQQEMSELLEWQTLYAACGKCLQIEKENMERLLNVL